MWAGRYAPFGEAYPDRWLHINAREYAGQYFWRTMIAPCTWENGTYRAQVRLPWYLPDDSEIYFLGIIEPYDTLDPRAVLLNGSMGDLWDWESREPPKVEGDGDGPGDEGPTDQSFITLVSESLLCLVILVITIVFGISVLIVLTRPKRDDDQGPVE